MVSGSATNMLILGLIVGVGLALLVPFVLISTRDLTITIDNLKNSYRPRENITFTISAEGLLQKHCNYHVFPEVEIHHLPDDLIVYSNRVPYLDISCDPSPSYISSHWTYPMRRENELYGINSQNETIEITEPGFYLVSAYFDRANTTKQFSVIADS
jgi:hypothetical protein